VFAGFFVMGFVDIVGIATNYAKQDLQLKDSIANLLPLMVFIWFALFSIPTGVLMNRIGRRKTVLAGMMVTAFGLVLPVFVYNFIALLSAFALVGIGNTILQVALNPLLTNLVSRDRLGSALTGGQLIKAIASFLGPAIAAFASASLDNWKAIFPIFATITVINSIWLAATPIVEPAPVQQTSSWRACLALLKDPFIVLLVVGVIAIVGIDVGLNTTLPKLLMIRFDLPLEKAGLGTSLYFISRTVGGLAGVILLAKMKNSRLFAGTVMLGLIALGSLLFATAFWLSMGLIFLLGLAVANVFPIIFAAALQRAGSRENEVSGLLIMGVSGGAVLLPVMGLIGDAKGPAWALAFLLLAWGWLLLVGKSFNDKNIL